MANIQAANPRRGQSLRQTTPEPTRCEGGESHHFEIVDKGYCTECWLLEIKSLHVASGIDRHEDCNGDMEHQYRGVYGGGCPNCGGLIHAKANGWIWSPHGRLGVGGYVDAGGVCCVDCDCCPDGHRKFHWDDRSDERIRTDARRFRSRWVPDRYGDCPCGHELHPGDLTSWGSEWSNKMDETMVVEAEEFTRGLGLNE